MVAVGSADKRLKIYGPTSGQRSATMRSQSPIHALAFSPDGSRLFAGEAGGLLRTWDPSTGDNVSQLDCRPDPVYAAATSPPDTLVAVAGGATTIELWDFEPVG